MSETTQRSFSGEPMLAAASCVDLLTRFSGSVPRYTSYPTALELAPCEDSRAIEGLLSRVGREARQLALYVHVPFCKSLCYFCACNKVITREESDKEAFITALQAEVARVHQSAGTQLHLLQVHIGGGSPSYLSPAQLRALFHTIAANFTSAPGIERSIELDPRTTTDEHLAILSEEGVHRVSLGIQDFDPYVQELINRDQPFEMVQRVVSGIRQRGFALNFDLIYGLPGQRQETFATTIDRVIELAPDRIALYGYAHVEWRNKVQKVFHRTPRPQEGERLALFLTAREMLLRAGYVWVGMDHFARPHDPLARAAHDGALTRNFMGYAVTPGDGVLGIGPSAISDLDGVLYQNEPTHLEYNARAQRGELPVAKWYRRTAEDSERRALIEEVMCMRPFNAELATRLQVVGAEIPTLCELERNGLITRCGGTIEVTDVGRYFVRSIASAFDSFLPGHRAHASPAFSKGA